MGGAHVSDRAYFDSAIWTPEGEFFFLPNPIQEATAEAVSVRDRNDGQGLNIGFDEVAGVMYGFAPPITLRELESHFSLIRGSTVVSQSEFAVVNGYDDLMTSFDRTLAYYPGIVPGEPGAVLPIEDVFPELATIDFEGVSDLYAVEGHIFMTLYGDDGLYLFGARDPSVIPEPSTTVLALVILIAAFAGRSALSRRTGT